MKKKIIFILIGICIVILFTIKFNTWLYVTVDQTRSNRGYDISVMIDGKQVFSQDSVYIPLMGHEKVKVPLRMGFHKITAISKQADAESEETVFLFFGQIVVVELFEKSLDKNGHSEFRIESMYNYVYE